MFKDVKWTKINLKTIYCTSKPLCSFCFSTNDVAKKQKGASTSIFRIIKWCLAYVVQIWIVICILFTFCKAIIKSSCKTFYMKLNTQCVSFVCLKYINMFMYIQLCNNRDYQKSIEQSMVWRLWRYLNKKRIFNRFFVMYYVLSCQ